MKYILALLWFSLPSLGYVAGYMVATEQAEAKDKTMFTACASPQHEGDKTIGKLVKVGKGLHLVCEYHSMK